LEACGHQIDGNKFSMNDCKLVLVPQKSNLSANSVKQNKSWQTENDAHLEVFASQLASRFQLFITIWS